MSVRFLVAIGVFLVAIVGGLTYAFSHLPHRGELFDKRGWSVVQGMDDPPSPSSGVVLARRDEFAVLGFKGVGPTTVRVYGAQPRWSWLLLNEHHADGEIKQLPKFASYDLPCSELRRIEQTVPDADPYAMEYLRSICT
jgi:hypothetical protein